MRMGIANGVSQVLTKSLNRIIVQATANTRFGNYLLFTIIHVTEHKSKASYSILLFYSIVYVKKPT